jgi:hypothetical protein
VAAVFVREEFATCFLSVTEKTVLPLCLIPEDDGSKTSRNLLHLSYFFNFQVVSAEDSYRERPKGGWLVGRLTGFVDKCIVSTT